MTTATALPIPLRPGSKVGAGITAVLGAILGIFVQYAPWGNGFIAVGHFAGCIAGALIGYSILRRFGRRPSWVNRIIALAVTFAVFGFVGYRTAHPSPRSTLGYMLGGPVPPNVEIYDVRCQWFDGQIYVARFHADSAAQASLLSMRPYELQTLYGEFPDKWRGAFHFAVIANRDWKIPPKAQLPRFFRYMSSPDDTTQRVESSDLLIDDATGDCWLVYSWT
ncbi:MAG: hypothetical protein JWM57_4362 [Phycisphaerales bacterium]|nr:hypothetical protein [Phycisphaerales bacterium]